MIVLAFLVFALTCCESIRPETSSAPGTPVLKEGQVLSGELHVSDFVVPLGTTILVVGGTTIHASGDVLIHGRLAVLPAESLTLPPDLHIYCQGFFFVDEFGELLGAAGASYDDPELDPYHIVGDYQGRDGGPGGSLHVQAPRYQIFGKVLAGRGGNASPGGAGGKGGSVIVRADIATYPGPHNPSAEGTVRGGRGGRGSAGYYLYDESDPETFLRFVPGGPSGDGGAAESHPAPEGLSTSALESGSDRALAGGEPAAGPRDSSVPLACDDGADGADTIGGPPASPRAAALARSACEDKEWPREPLEHREARCKQPDRRGMPPRVATGAALIDGVRVQAPPGR